MPLLRICLITLTIFFSASALSQSSDKYTVNTFLNGSLIADKNGNPINLASSPNLVPNNTYWVNSGLIDIGFDFMFMGKHYTHLIAGSNGQLALAVENTPSYALQTNAPNQLRKSVTYPPTIVNSSPVIAPFWDMLLTARSGATIREGLFGTYPNRCAVIEWNVGITSTSTTNPSDGVFQVRLYEGTGEIEFVYGKMNIGPSSQLVTASVGFTAGPSTNHFIAIKELTGFSVTRNATEEDPTRLLVNSSTPGNITGLHSSADGSRRRILFTPENLTGNFTSSGVIRQLATSMQLNWTDDIINKMGYLVYKSEGGGTNYILETSLPPTATNYTASGLQPNTIYQWKIVPYNEGNLKKELVLIDSTRCSMGYDYTIGPSGNFTTIQAAIDSLALWGIKAPVKWELQPGYSFSSETLPIRFKKHPCFESMNKVTIQPASNSSFHFVNNTTSPVFLLDSASNFIIDGRAGGTGGIALGFEGGGEMIRIKNGWENQVQFVEFKTNNNTPGSGPVVIESTTGAGSHHNQIRNCEFHDRGSSYNLPSVMVSGKSSNNSISDNNTVSSNSFYNFRQFAINADGEGWTISNNSFYATQPITSTDTAGFIRLHQSGSALSHQITGNYFGGSSSMATGNVLKWNVPKSFAGIEVCGTATVINNRFQRLDIAAIPATGFAPNTLDLIKAGTVTPSYTNTNFSILNNHFGDSTIADSIQYSGNLNYFLNGSIIRFIGAGPGQVDISGNKLINIHTSPGSTGFSFHLISAVSNATISNNIIGSDNHAVRIEHRGTGELIAIHTTGNIAVGNNLVTNLTSKNKLIGIIIGNNYNSVFNNTLRHLKTLEGLSTSDFFSVAGIASFSSSAVIEGNRIFHMEDSSATNQSQIVSLFSKNGHLQVRKNLIDGLVQHQSGTASRIHNAFEVSDDYSLFENNMVRLGVDSAGNTVTKGGFLGFGNNHTSGNILRHNSFYITGNSVPAENLSSSYCAFWLGTSTFVNNIFVNNRTYNTSTTPPNRIYLVSTESHDPNMDHNIYFQPPGYLFAQQSFEHWRSTTNNDANSIFMAPNFINPEGPTRTLNLHVTGPTIIEGKGSTYNTSIDDIDGQVRNALTPVDIGADAGNFIAVDIAPPNIYVTPLSDAFDTVSRYITVKITDTLSGLKITGNTRPMIWYRKNYPTQSAWQSGFGDLISGNGISGNWKFFIDHSLIGISDGGSDSVQYYFVAQDSTNINIRTNPLNGVHTSVTQQVTPPPVLYKYRINNSGYIITPVVNVGTGEHYESLTKDGGLFEGLGKDSVAHHSLVTVRITSHLLENGKWALDSLITLKNIRVKIVPSHDSIFIIRNQLDLDKTLIRLHKANNIIIDGSFNGSGRWLRFVNKHSNASMGKPTISISHGSDSIIISNSELQGNANIIYPQQGIIQMEGATSNIKFYNNIFSNIAGTVSKPSIGIFCPNGSTVDKLTATKNHFINLDQGGIYFNHGSKNITIDSNHIYWNDASTHSGQSYNGIFLLGFNTIHTVNNNYIGGSQPYCEGQPWINNTAFQNFAGIQVQAQHGFEYSKITNNTIKNFRLPNHNGGNFYAIHAYGRILVDGNTIGDSTVSNTIETGSGAAGINTGGNKAQIVSNNLVAGIIVNDDASDPGSIYGLWIGADSSHVFNNLVRDLKIANGTPYSSNGTANGIYVGNNSKGHLLEANEIYNIYSGSTQTVAVSGIRTSSAYNGGGKIKRNRIYNLTIPNSVNGSLNGIYLNQNGSWTAENNQITLTNQLHPNSIHIYGIRDEATMNTENNRSVAYNTVFIGGSQTGGNTHSYGWHTSGIGITQFFKNNIIINQRTGGFGHHGAIAIKTNSPSSSWPAHTADYNFYVVSDTNRSFLWNSDTLSLSEWRSVSGNGANSFGTPSSEITPSDFFVDIQRGNLNINTHHPSSWYVNGKGLPVNTINEDFNTVNVRSTLISTGSTDIGSDEFNTTTSPPALIVMGNHQPGGSDTLYMNNDIVAVINWASQGSLPTISNAQLYTGTWPNDLTNNNTIANAHTMNAYLSIQATGGSNYAYDLIMYYDSSMLGTITDPATMMINKKQSGIPGTWTLHPTTVTSNTLIVSGLNSFSEFTATDANASLAVGLPSAELSISAQAVSSNTILTGSQFSMQFTAANTGTAAAGAHKVSFYLSQDPLLQTGNNGDQLLGNFDISSIASGANTGSLTKVLTMPCTPAGNYYLLIVADGQGQVNETNETNNVVALSITVSTGVTAPQVPVITATPSAIVCAPETVILSASSTGCTDCIYSWSNGSTGNSITVSSSGNYTVTASNVCGSAQASQLVTITAQPVVTVSASLTTICAGASVQLSASGADSYNWSPATGLNSTSGNMVTATPAVTTTYTVTGSSNGCSMDKTVTITVNPLPSTPVITQSGNNLQSSAPAGNQWYLNGSLINGATGAVYTPLATGNYTVRVTLNGCSSAFSAGFAFIPTAINSPELDKRIISGPNPTENILYIQQQGSHHELTLTILDLNGRILHKNRFTTSISIDMRKFSAGGYIILIENLRNGERIQRMVIKK